MNNYLIGLEINLIKQKLNNMEKHKKNYIFGIIDSIVYNYTHYNEGAARDLYDNLLKDFSYGVLIGIIDEIDVDLLDSFISFYENEIK